MKKIIIISFIVLLGTKINLISEQTKDKVTYNQKQVITASYITPNSLQELEEISPIIVKGKFTGEREHDKDPNVIGPSTISQFKVDKVYKGKIYENTISVLEPFEIIDSDFNNIEGYIPMEKNSEYILFLRENQTKEGMQYTIKSISFGKYNTSKNIKINPQKSKINYLEEAIINDFITESQEICDTYNEIKSNVLDKYLD